jgi:hypothetical protein
MNTENLGEILYFGDESDFGSCPHMAGGSGSQGGCGGSGGCGGNAITAPISSDND